MSGYIPAMRTRLSSVILRPSRLSTRPFSSSIHVSKQGPGAGESFEQANDPLPSKETPNVSKTNELAMDAMGAGDRDLQESQADGEKQRQLQSPNRANVWSRSQMPREMAMSGPRFEQTIMSVQPQPYAAIDLIHKQPVRWVETRTVACDGGGGPLGHPRIFINVDKPQICWCTYCGLPYAHTHHKKHLESLPSTTYPLEPTNDPAQVVMPSTPSQKGEIQGQYAHLKGQLESQSVSGKGFEQR